jgi:hypothetical protein
MKRWLDACKCLFEGGWFRLNQDRNTELNADFIGYFDKTLAIFHLMHWQVPTIETFAGKIQPLVQ